MSNKAKELTDENIDEILNSIDDGNIENIDNNIDEENREVGDDIQDSDGDSNSDVDSGDESTEQGEASVDEGDGDSDNASDNNEPEDEGDSNSDKENDSENDAPTNDDGSNAEKTPELNIEEYNKYKAFYESITSPLKANGREVKHDDPEKIRRLVSMGEGFSEKMRSFKKVKPLIKTLEKYGVSPESYTDEKLHLALDAVFNKDKGAVKKLIEEAELDPFNEEYDNLKYTPKEDKIVSQADIVIDDVFEIADQQGVAKDLNEILEKEWIEDGSIEKLVNNKEQFIGLASHLIPLPDGTRPYDLVMQKVQELGVNDPYGLFTEKPLYEQYLKAGEILDAEAKEKQKEEQEASRLEKLKADAERIEAEKRKILQKRQEAEYQEKVEAEQQKINQKRKDATRLSTAGSANKKVNTSQPFDVNRLTDEEIDKILAQIE